jgi:hypothetical protein
MESNHRRPRLQRGALPTELLVRYDRDMIHEELRLSARRRGKTLALAMSIQPGTAVVSVSPSSAASLLDLVRRVRGQAMARSLKVYAAGGDKLVRVLPTSTLIGAD